MAKRSFQRFVEQELGKFPHFVIFAVLEWLLIILLFIEGILAFLANVYSKFFELKIPCLLCTRLDHVLVHRNPDFYYNESICDAHKKDVSSLAYCHVHKKLSDIKKMCEGCLLSFATEKESDCDTYKSLVGILHKDLELLVDDDQELHLALPSGKKEDEKQVENSSSHLCSCCGKPLKVKSSNSKVLKSSGLSSAPAPSPRAPFVTARNQETRNLDLPHTRYSQLRFTSDNQSELPEDVDGSTPLGRQYADDEDKTPNFAKGNKFFGIPLTDSAAASPKWIMRRKSPLEKTEFAGESIEGQVPNEADGETILHHLKRQVRLDRKSLMDLYMELDEERSASAVAANNAMAMITRLQAEKASVQMEALQYQRMMEEQAEYDQEALQASNNLLAKREEEMKDLEDEIEAYRLKYGCLEEEDYERLGVETGKDYQDLKSQSFASCNEKSGSSSPISSVNESSNGVNATSKEQDGALQEKINGGRSLDRTESSSRMERNRRLGRLQNLEKKLQLPRNDNGTVSSQSSCDIPNLLNEETGKGSKSTLTNELLHLHERVKALEADGGFLQHIANSLHHGSEEGTKLLTEISHNLQKLHHFVSKPYEELDFDA
ncbi:Zein-binding domain-containing protein [Cephalotus follicularis]|uniref:Zein-binding domain-containing protein n=1 Tax=Cephalotus follicularis TaxID=3775 RepID=A0A1Q3C2L1_CEPFO|nr:Zein-binding domain-containing protein [Cephalotus follicularis]